MLEMSGRKTEQAMRVAWMMAIILVLAGLSAAQEKPLGDVARDARAQKSQSPHAAKVVTNEDFQPHLEPVAATDNPLDVINKARLALLNDTAHSCLRETSGNSGPGWADERLAEVAAPDRVHIVISDLRPKATRGEYIIIGKDIYRRTEIEPWERMQAGDVSVLGLWSGLLLPDVLKFGYSSGDLKLIGPDTINGTPVFQYEYKVHVGDMNRTIEMWIGANDHLPRKTHMLTVTTSALTAPVTWQESMSCTYGGSLKIEQPM